VGDLILDADCHRAYSIDALSQPITYNELRAAYDAARAAGLHRFSR